jgi:hypothetical protein
MHLALNHSLLAQPTFPYPALLSLSAEYRLENGGESLRDLQSSAYNIRISSSEILGQQVSSSSD